MATEATQQTETGASPTEAVIEGGEEAQKENAVETQSKEIEAQEEPAPSTESVIEESPAVAAVGEAVAAVEGDAVVVAENTAVTAKETVVTAEESVVTSDETVVTSDETVVTSEETVVAVEESVVAAEATVTPAEESASPAEETAAPADETAAPAEETAAPAEKTAAPAEETAAPVEETAAPAEETAAPAEETAAPAEETAAPAEEAVAPAVETVVTAEEPVVATEETVVEAVETVAAEETVEKPVDVELTEATLSEAPAPEVTAEDNAAASEEKPVEAIESSEAEVTSEVDPVNAEAETSDIPVAPAADEGVEEAEEEEAEEEEEEEEDVFAGLSTFTGDVFGLLGLPAEPLSSEERAPKPLQTTGQDPNHIVRLLQDLMTYDEEEPEVTYGLGALDLHGRTSSVSHLLAALVTTLDPQHLRRLATRIMSDTCMWISRLFRYFDSTAYIHEDVREGVVRVCRMLLHIKYPKYATDGYEALYTRPPIIYTSSTVRPGLPQHISSMLGLGTGCVRVVPCNTVVGSTIAMDTAALERMMAEDMSSGKKPLIVLANAGGGALGGVDNVSRIQELCNSNDAWLHVEGHALAAITLPNAPNLPAKVGDSMTLPLSLWLGVPSLPYITLYRAYEASAMHAAGLTALSLHVRLSCLPLWSTLQTLGQTGVTSRLHHAFELSQYLQRHLAALPLVRLLSPSPPAGDTVTTIQDLVTKPISTAQLLETVTGTVVFQYVEEGADIGSKNPEYYDNLNSWLGQVVRRDVGSIPLELVQLETAGLVLRWSPLEGPETHQITLAHVEHLIQSLNHQLEILNATVKQRKAFAELVASSNNLELVEIPGWAGLGGVRYLIDLWLTPDLDAETAKADANALNVHLVQKLKATDSAFSLGEGGDGHNCVRFGMVTAETDISELLALVLNTGKEIESSSKILEQMTDIVQKGIEAATEDLKRENEERLWQEGIVRHIPIVGSLYSWFSPPPPPGIKGRSLDLAAGVLESTENIYQYHMQIRHGATPPRAETKLPPAPSVQTTVTPTSASSPSHSRTSSTTSARASGPSHSRQASDQKIVSNLANSNNTPTPTPVES